MQGGRSIKASLILAPALCLMFNPPGTFAQHAANDPGEWSLGGHAKYQYIHTQIPDDSVLHDINGSKLVDHNLELRLKAAWRRGRWDLKTHFQAIGTYSDSLEGFRGLDLPGFPAGSVINDDRRWFDLTHELTNSGKNASVLRLDRASIAYSGDKAVLRFGRQAISWGNGLLFTPMDIFNPFDPTAVDKEYKTGDDMLYAQYLLNNGDDIQAVGVVRRDPISGDVEQDLSSLAVKYHGFLGTAEYDILLSDHYSETVIGLGLSADRGGAIWRGDLVWTDAKSGSVSSAVAGVSYSWIAGGRNWTGFLEYYYNGFGQDGGDYSTADLVENPGLLHRLARGEVFNIGQHYLGISATVEVSPLLHLTPNLFINLFDPSALAQLVLAYDWKQDIQILGAINIPVGPGGTEYGGIESDGTGHYVSTGASLFAQLAWYF